MKNIADAAKDVTAVIERHDLNIARHRHARFQIQHHFSIAADRNSEGIQTDHVTLGVAKIALRHDYLSRSGLFKGKSSQRRRATGKESFANRQQAIEIVDVSVAVLVASIKELRHTNREI